MIGNVWDEIHFKKEKFQTNAFRIHLKKLRKGEKIMIQKPKGTKDVLTDEIDKWTYIEYKATDTFENFGYKEIRVPTFEYTELFERGVGDTTDVVQN